MRLRYARDALTRCAARALFHPYRWRTALRRHAPRRLQVGSGRNRLEGWINADITPSADVIVFMERRLPFPDATLDRIYLEHVLEHASYETGLEFLRDAKRVLRPGGVIRIAVPDLEDLVRGYLDDDWRRFDWVNWPEHAFIGSRAQMINVGFRWWGHQYLYDRDELARVLAGAGFTNVEFFDSGQSRHADLRALETRPDSTLIAEATKH